MNSFPLLLCVDFAQSEAHFAKQFDIDGNPWAALFQMQQDRLQIGGQLQELTGHVDTSEAEEIYGR